MLLCTTKVPATALNKYEKMLEAEFQNLKSKLREIKVHWKVSYIIRLLHTLDFYIFDR